MPKKVVIQKNQLAFKRDCCIFERMVNWDDMANYMRLQNISKV